MIGTMEPGAVGFAGSIYDIRGGTNWTTGTVVSYDNRLDALTDDGELQTNGDILDIEGFQLPPAFNVEFDASNPIELYRVIWTPKSYADRTVTAGDANHLNNDVYTDNFGSSQAYTGVPGSVEFLIACPTDVNHDSEVNTLDFLFFLNAWTAGDMLADWNDDGVVNTLDFLEYLNDWVAGC